MRMGFRPDLCTFPVRLRENSMPIKAYAVKKAKGKFEAFQYDPGKLGKDQVDIAVDFCGICHSDLSMLNNDWGITKYPFVGGHEVIGKIAAVGENVEHLKVGQTVGLGWYSKACMLCPQCLGGDHNLCDNSESTIVGRYGGFADKVRANKECVIPLPDGLDPVTSGPMFCGGITVFNPIIQNDIKSTDRVGVVGIGGLGHLAVQFLKAWGCEVTAFSSTPEKEKEAKQLGAQNFVSSTNASALKRLSNSFDMILVAVNVDLDWMAYINLLKAKGKLHFVGAVGSVNIPVFPLISGQKSLGGSPVGSPATIVKMLEFAQRHKIAPVTETFPMSRINEAFERLHSGKTRYRLVLKNDFK